MLLSAAASEMGANACTRIGSEAELARGVHCRPGPDRLGPWARALPADVRRPQASPAQPVQHPHHHRYHNLLVHPDTTIKVGGYILDMHATELTGHERDQT